QLRKPVALRAETVAEMMLISRSCSTGLPAQRIDVELQAPEGHRERTAHATTVIVGFNGWSRGCTYSGVAPAALRAQRMPSWAGMRRPAENPPSPGPRQRCEQLFS